MGVLKYRCYDADKLYINGVEKKPKELRSSDVEEEQSIRNETDLVSCWFFSNLHSLIFFHIWETQGLQKLSASQKFE